LSSLARGREGAARIRDASVLVRPAHARSRGRGGGAPGLAGSAQAVAHARAAARATPRRRPAPGRRRTRRLGAVERDLGIELDRAELQLVKAWEPRRLPRLRPGRHHIVIDLLDPKALQVHGPVNRTARTFHTP